MILLCASNINRPESSTTRLSDYFSQGTKHVWVAFCELWSVLGVVYPLSPIHSCDDPLN